MRHILSKYNRGGKAPFLKRSTTNDYSFKRGGDTVAGARLLGHGSVLVLVRIDL